MPRYRVVLEFDHPGRQEVNGAMVLPPEEWNWPYIMGEPYIMGDTRDLDVAVYEREVVEEFVPRTVVYSSRR